MYPDIYILQGDSSRGRPNSSVDTNPTFFVYHIRTKLKFIFVFHFLATSANTNGRNI